MTKKELKEAIAATITENGQKGITGQALANLLNEIVDAAGEGGGNAGGGTLTFAVEMEINTGTMSSGPNEANAKVYQTLVEGLDNATAYSVSVLSSIDLSDYGMGIVRTVTYPTNYGFIDGDIRFGVVDGTEYAVYEDGSIVKVQQSL